MPNELCYFFQHSKEKDYVVHLARTPRPAPNKDVKVEKTLPKVLEESQEPPADGHFVVKRVRDIRESWVADHAKHVRITLSLFPS